MVRSVAIITDKRNKRERRPFSFVNSKQEGRLFTIILIDSINHYIFIIYLIV